MQPIETPIKFKNLEFDSQKAASQEYIIRKSGEYFISKKFPDSAMIVSPRKNMYEYIVNGERITDLGSFKPQLLDNLADYIVRMKEVPNTWELEALIKRSLHRDDYDKVIF